MTRLYKAVIELPPDLGHVVKKNNRPIFRGRIGKGPRLRKAEAYLVEAMHREKIGITAVMGPIDQFIQAKFTFYFPRDKVYTKKGQVSKHLPDLSNLYELPQDCLTKAKVIQDDRLIQSHDGSRIKVSSKGKYYLDIELYSFKPEFT